MEKGEIVNGRYKILRQIGVGGMGSVFLVEDLELNSEVVAFKILHQQAEVDPEIFKRFRNEVLIARSLSHPSIVRTHDLGRTTGGIYYITMEYVEGKTLKELLKVGGPSSREARQQLLTYYLSILRGLEYAHSKGVIHRDIKPANILITENGEAKIADFGTARSNELSEGLTKTGFSVGTPEYMAPEQIRGEPLDQTCDIYSLGVLLFEILTGDKPFSAESPIGVAYKQLNEPLPTLSDKGIIGLDALQEIIDNCTKKVRLQRYQTVGEIISDFEGILGGEPVLKQVHSRGDWSLGGERFPAGDGINIDISEVSKSRSWLFILLVVVVVLAGYFYFFGSPKEVPDTPQLIESSDEKKMIINNQHNEEAIVEEDVALKKGSRTKVNAIPVSTPSQLVVVPSVSPIYSPSLVIASPTPALEESKKPVETMLEKPSPSVFELSRITNEALMRLKEKNISSEVPQPELPSNAFNPGDSGETLNIEDNQIYESRFSGTIDILDSSNGIKEPHGLTLTVKKKGEIATGIASITGIGEFRLNMKYYERGVEIELFGQKDSYKLVGGKREDGFKGTFVSTTESNSKGSWLVKQIR